MDGMVCYYFSKSKTNTCTRGTHALDVRTWKQTLITVQTFNISHVIQDSSKLNNSFSFENVILNVIYILMTFYKKISLFSLNQNLKLIAKILILTTSPDYSYIYWNLELLQNRSLYQKGTLSTSAEWRTSNTKHLRDIKWRRGRNLTHNNLKYLPPNLLPH